MQRIGRMATVMAVVAALSACAPASRDTQPRDAQASAQLASAQLASAQLASAQLASALPGRYVLSAAAGEPARVLDIAPPRGGAGTAMFTAFSPSGVPAQFAVTYTIRGDSAILRVYDMATEEAADGGVVRVAGGSLRLVQADLAGQPDTLTFVRVADGHSQRGAQ